MFHKSVPPINLAWCIAETNPGTNLMKTNRGKLRNTEVALVLLTKQSPAQILSVPQFPDMDFQEQWSEEGVAWNSERHSIAPPPPPPPSKRIKDLGKSREISFP